MWCVCDIVTLRACEAGKELLARSSYLFINVEDFATCSSSLPLKLEKILRDKNSLLLYLWPDQGSTTALYTDIRPVR